MSLLFNSAVVTFPGGLRIREAILADHAERLGKTPQAGTQRLACSHICCRASEAEKNANHLDEVEKVSWPWG